MTSFKQVLDIITNRFYNPDGDDGLEYFGDELELQELVDARHTAVGIQSAAKSVIADIDDQIAAQLKGRAMRVGDRLARTQHKRKFKVFDVPGLMKWIGEDFVTAFNPNQVRVTALRAIAEKRGVDPRVPIDTFCEYEVDDEPSLTFVPMERAPQRYQKLEDGEVG